MRKSGILLFLLCFFIIVLSSDVLALEDSRYLSLEEAYQMALHKSRSIQQIQYDSDRGEQVRDDIAGRVQYIPFDSPSPATYQAFISLVVADMSWQMSKKSISAEEDKIFLSVVRNYIDVQEKIDNLLMAQKSVENAKRQYNIERISYQIGTISKGERDIAESRFKAMEIAQELAELDLQKSFENLNSLIGLRAAERPILSDIPEYLPMEAVYMDGAIANAINQSPSIWLAEQRVDLAELQLQLHNFNMPGDPYRAKEVDIKKAEVTAVDAKEQMRNLVRSLYNSINLLEQNHSRVLSELEIAKEKLNIKQQMNNNGLASDIELQMAELEVHRVENNLKQIEFQHHVLKLTFEKPWAYTAGM